MRLLFVLLFITLAACSNAPVASGVPAPGLGGQSIYNQATLESANQTRVALDAQIADASTQSAVATADWQATQSSLSVVQTQSAEARANADATATAAAQATSTQSAAERITATANADATQFTHAMRITQNAQSVVAGVEAAEAEARKAQAQSAIARSVEFDRFWHDLLTYGGLLLLLVWGGVLVALAVIGVQAVESQRLLAFRAAYQMRLIALEERRAESERVRAEALLSLIKTINGQPMVFTPRNGGEYRPLIIEAAPVLPPDLARAQDWRRVARQLLAHAVELERSGVAHPFSETNLGPLCFTPGTQQVWLDGYRKAMEVLVSAGVLVRNGPRKAPAWAADWTPDRVAHEFDRTPLPYLPATPPPDVQMPLWSFAEAA